jgi:hypothetical protein
MQESCFVFRHAIRGNEPKLKAHANLPGQLGSWKWSCRSVSFSAIQSEVIHQPKLKAHANLPGQLGSSRFFQLLLEETSQARTSNQRQLPRACLPIPSALSMANSSAVSRVVVKNDSPQVRQQLFGYSRAYTVFTPRPTVDRYTSSRLQELLPALL